MPVAEFTFRCVDTGETHRCGRDVCDAVTRVGVREVCGKTLMVLGEVEDSPVYESRAPKIKRQTRETDVDLVLRRRVETFMARLFEPEKMKERVSRDCIERKCPLPQRLLETEDTDEFVDWALQTYQWLNDSRLSVEAVAFAVLLKAQTGTTMPRFSVPKVPDLDIMMPAVRLSESFDVKPSAVTKVCACIARKSNGTCYLSRRTKDT